MSEEKGGDGVARRTRVQESTAVHDFIDFIAVDQTRSHLTLQVSALLTYNFETEVRARLLRPDESEDDRAPDGRPASRLRWLWRHRRTWSPTTFDCT